MRFRSTEESRRNSAVTILSIIETVVGMAVSMGMAFYMQSMLHIAIGACVAPLLLLRTDESVAMGKRLFERLRPKHSEIGAADGFTMLEIFKLYITEVIRFVYLISLSLWVRIYSTAFCVIKSPFDSMMSVRRNWIQSVFCTDVIHKPLELVPGSGKIVKVVEETLLGQEGVLIYIFDIARILQKKQVFNRIMNLFFFALPLLLVLLLLKFASPYSADKDKAKTIYMLMFFSYTIGIISVFPNVKMYICMLIALSYRLSLKSTAILWLPLLLVPTESDSIEDHLKEERESALSKLSLAYSSMIIGLFSAKVFLLPHVIDWWNSLPSSKILNVWIMPEKLHSWHVAGAAGAGLNLIGYLFFYEKAVRKLESGTWSETFVRNVAVSLKFVIYSILIYTIPAGIYITWKAIDFVKLPKFDWNPFPWW